MDTDNFGSEEGAVAADVRIGGFGFLRRINRSGISVDSADADIGGYNRGFSLNKNR